MDDDDEEEDVAAVVLGAALQVASEVVPRENWDPREKAWSRESRDDVQ